MLDSRLIQHLANTQPRRQDFGQTERIFAVQVDVDPRFIACLLLECRDLHISQTKTAARALCSRTPRLPPSKAPRTADAPPSNLSWSSQDSSRPVSGLKLAQVRPLTPE